ncbi:hypothetical protein C8J57DRAFT_1250967 [Mycena rebaudengoi]|nr:hypothetical protein C8J57DRAFT_1250967 [Mycena rebaudengoi]
MAITAYLRPLNTPLHPAQPDNRAQIRFLRANGPITVERRWHASTVVVPTQCRPNAGGTSSDNSIHQFLRIPKGPVFTFFRTNPPGPAPIHIGLPEFWSSAPARGTKVSGETLRLERKVGDTYELDSLPDHRGPYFAHQESKLVQRDYRDVNGELITPGELYEKLTEGTLFFAQPQNKIYHIYVEKLRIINKGYGGTWDPLIPVMPSSGPATPKKQGHAEHDADADTAFDAFNSVLPPQKTRK